MLEAENCPICESENLRVLKRYKYQLQETKEIRDIAENASYKEKRLWIFLEKIWVKDQPAEIVVDICKNCGLIFSNPRLTAEDIKTKYKTISELNSLKNDKFSRPASKTQERAERIYKQINKLRKKSLGTGKILDYGGAEGYNLYPFVKNNYVGFIVDYVKKDYPINLKYIGKDIDAIKKGDSFDVILLCHTLEHAIDPKGMAKNLSSYLREDGLIFIEVPLGCLHEWKELGEPLTHVNFFSEESLTKCLRKAGLEILYLSTDYQWVTHSKSWCINIIGAKTKKSKIGFYSTNQQMRRPHQAYNLKKIIDNHNYYKEKIKQKFLH